MVRGHLILMSNIKEVRTQRPVTDTDVILKVLDGVLHQVLESHRVSGAFLRVFMFDQAEHGGPREDMRWVFARGGPKPEPTDMLQRFHRGYGVSAPNHLVWHVQMERDKEHLPEVFGTNDLHSTHV